MALQYVAYPARSDLDAVIANQISADPYLTEGISSAQIKDLFFIGSGVRNLGFSGQLNRAILSTVELDIKNV